MNILKRATTLTLATAMLAATLPGIAFAGYYARVVGVPSWDTLNVRTCGSTQCNVIAELGPYDYNIWVRGCQGGWCRIDTNYGSGWASKKHLRRQ